METNSVPALQINDFQPIVGCIGLPSAGKSTLINALIGRRILHTGVCRTTKEVHYIGPTNRFNLPDEQFHEEHPVSDDGIKISIIDLPGVADTENVGKENNFDEMTRTWVLNCDIVLWISDIQTAFLTTHEKNEFEKIRALLENHSKETGTLHQMAIVLSKYNHFDIVTPGKITPGKRKSKKKIRDEIEDVEEDTTVQECYHRVQKHFGDNYPIKKINAFGRIMHHPHTSETLKKLVVRMGTPTNANITFQAAWMITDYQAKQQQSYLQCFVTKPSLASQNNERMKVLTTIGELFQNITSRKTLHLLFQILTSSTQTELDNAVTKAGIKVHLFYEELWLNTVCLQIGGEKFGFCNNNRLHENRDNLNLCHFRCYLIQGRNTKPALQSFFEIHHSFQTKVFIENNASWCQWMYLLHVIRVKMRSNQIFVVSIKNVLQRKC